MPFGSTNITSRLLLAWASDCQRSSAFSGAAGRRPWVHFLIAGAARIVFVHHMTFCINSLCHWIGKQPYSSKCSARDSMIMAFFTFGEGYHNFHHEFQHDYRNGVKPWQFDPTKWTIWLLNKTGLVTKLRTVPEEIILKAQIAERQRRLTETLSGRQTPISESLHAILA